MTFFRIKSLLYYKILLLSSLVATLIIGVGIGFLASRYLSGSELLLNPLREQSHQYKFINPLLAVGDVEQLRAEPGFENKIFSIAEEYLKNPEIVTEIGIYYRDLNTGRWAGFNQKEKFAPASMYKIAMLLTVLKMAETNPSILQSEVIFDKSINQPGAQEGIEPEKRLEANRRYTINELLTRMIVYSDNEAATTLLHFTGASKFEELFAHLGVAMPELGDTSDTMSAQTFSIFFRILYNATYLTKELSEQALTLLSMTSFNDGIIAGVPNGTTVSHKFGRRTFTEAEQAGVPLELHDCGIVYIPSNPYLVCIMTKGRNDAELEKIIADISEQTYKTHIEFNR